MNKETVLLRLRANKTPIDQLHVDKDKLTAELVKLKSFALIILIHRAHNPSGLW